MARILSLRGVPSHALEYMVIGSTIPWHWKFWTAPLVASCMGRRLPGYHVEQACATGLQAVLLAGAEIESRAHDAVGVLTFDRTSDSPVGVFPERRAHQRARRDRRQELRLRLARALRPHAVQLRDQPVGVGVRVAVVDQHVGARGVQPARDRRADAARAAGDECGFAVQVRGHSSRWILG